jgi:gamma-glutamyltranspeptidase / glutathione hydrolase
MDKGMKLPEQTGTRHMVVTGHPLATEAAFEILESGGNAIDAAACAGITLCVVAAEHVNLGGIAPILIYSGPEHRVYSIAGVGHWPARITPDWFIRCHDGQIPVGVPRSVVPAAVDAWLTVLRRWGTMSFGDVAAAAIHHARGGFTVLEHTAQVIRAYRDEFALFPTNAAIFMPGGHPLEKGATLRLPELAATLQYLVDEERAVAGDGRERGLDAVRAAFYRGDIAREIVRFQEAHGGLLAMHDLADFSSQIEEPLHDEWNGLTLHVGDTWCQGAALLQMCKMLDARRVEQLGHNTPPYIQELASIAMLAMEDRDRFYADPRTTPVPIAELLSDDYALSRRSEVRKLCAGDATAHRSSSAERAFAGDTAQISIVDRLGNAVSATPSDPTYFGGPIIPSLGILASPRGLQGRADPNHPNCAAPGKRPRVTPSPVLAMGPDGMLMPMGSPGSDVIVQALFHFLINLRVFAFSPQASAEAPRFASFDFESSAPPNVRLPKALSMERRLDPTVGEEMERRGYRLRWWPEYASLAGAVAAVIAEPARGVMTAAADPRRPTAAACR